MLLLWSSSQRLPPFALAFALQTCSKATSPSLLGHHWAGKCSLVFNNSLLQLSIPYLMFVTLENLCIACAFGGFLGLKFGYRDGVRGGGGKGIEGIRSGLSLAAAWSSCSVTINPKYSFFWTFLMAHMLLQGMKAGELLVSVSDCALGFAIVQMCSLGSGVEIVWVVLEVFSVYSSTCFWWRASLYLIDRIKAQSKSLVAVRVNHDSVLPILHLLSVFLPK